MATKELLAALSEIEIAVDFSPPIGASELPPELRYFRVLLFIKEHICPSLAATVNLSKKPEGEIAAVVADCLLTALSSVPLPVATVSKYLAAMGVSRFCDDPSTLVK